MEIIYQSLKLVVRLKADFKNEARIFFKATCIQYCIGGLSQCYKAIKEIKDKEVHKKEVIIYRI